MGNCMSKRGIEDAINPRGTTPPPSNAIPTPVNVGSSSTDTSPMDSPPTANIAVDDHPSNISPPPIESKEASSSVPSTKTLPNSSTPTAAPSDIADDSTATKPPAPSPLTSVGVTVEILQSPLMGSVFTWNDKEVGVGSIHFDEEDGCYVSFEHDRCSNWTLKDGTPMAKRMFFTEQTFNLDERKFTGVTEYGGVWDGAISERYELTFDTQFLCVLSGRSVYKKENGEEETDVTYGDKTYYTNTSLTKVNEETETRLRGEGASETSIAPVVKTFRKNRRAKIQAELDENSGTEGNLLKELEGRVFQTDDKEVGTLSLHFDTVTGPFISQEEEKFDDGNMVPSRISFSKYSFNENSRRLIGIIDYGGRSIAESTHVTYEMIFDTNYVCVVSGLIVHTKVDKSEKIEVLGSDLCFILANRNNDDIDTDLCLILANRNNDDIDTVTRLKAEGATAKTINAISKTIAACLKAKYDTGNKFGELTNGYFFTTKWAWKYGQYQFGEETTEYIDMTKPRQCYYQKKNIQTGDYETIPLVAPSTIDPSTIPLVEYRGLTLRQLRAVVANAWRRCVEEGWKNDKDKSLTIEEVTLYDVLNYIILPFTEERKQSLVTCLPSTAGPQPPRFFASHWWGEPVVDFLKCLEQAVRDFSLNANDDDERRGGGLTADTPVWICAYSINQHNLADDIADDPRDSGFTKAMGVAEGRTVSILDKGGTIFDRIWCDYELYLTLVRKTKGENGAKGEKGRWAVYTAHSHKVRYGKEERDAVGIVSGGVPADEGNARSTAQRESSFPFELITKSLLIKVEKAIASVEKDRIQILNVIIGHEGESTTESPPASHPKYDEVNDAVIAAFISSIPCMQGMSTQADDDTWQRFLAALSKGKEQLDLYFSFDEDGWKDLKGGRAADLVSHLPPTVSKLKIWDAYGDKFGVGFVDAISGYVRKTTTIEFLDLDETKAGEGEGGKAGVRLAEAIETNTTIKTLGLWYTDLMDGENVERWGAALNANTTIKELRVNDEFVEKLKEMTKDRTPKLKIT